MTDGDLSLHFSSTRRAVAKWAHFFPVYERLFSEYQGRPLTLVEVGVGDGGSLEAWRRYFGPSARIIGIDIDPAAKQLEADGFEIIIGDQADPDWWARHLPAVGPIDILIDDGGHRSAQQIVTVASTLPHIRDGGIIVVEDTHTSYMPKQYPAARGFGFMQFAQHVVDVMHLRNPNVVERAADGAGLGGAIHSVQFFESLVVFHVDRRLCGPSKLLEAGVDQLTATPGSSTLQFARQTLESQPRWIRSLFQPARRVIGMARRALNRLAGANRVRRYFR